MSAASAPRKHGLDTLRALAIVLVFLYHYRIFVSHEPTFGWGSMVGWVGVDLFFVLSGYLIANQLFAGLARGQRLSLPHFYARRLLRTVPAYWVVLAFYFLLPAVMGGKEPPALWRFLSFTQNIQLQPGTAFSHAWSLCIEEQFYLLLPASLLLMRRTGLSLRLGWMALASLVLIAITWRSLLWLDYGREADGALSGYYPNVYYATLCRIDEFLPGVAVALLKNFHRDLWQRLMQHGGKILIAGLASTTLMLVLAYRSYYVEGYGYGYFMSGFGYSLIAMSFAVLVMAALSPHSALHRLRVPGAASLALWSYAIYLSHKPIAYIVQQQLAPLGLAGNAPLTIPIVVIACLVGGWLLFRLVEAPFMALRDRRYPTQFD